MSAHYKCKFNCGGTDCIAKVKYESKIDLNRYAGTYGGYADDEPKHKSLLQRFVALMAKYVRVPC